jgi:hypothetical protein
LIIKINVISDSDLSSAESNLDINNTYDLVNDDFSITDFRENDVSNFEAAPSSSESQGRGQGRSRSHSHLQTKILKKINKLKSI